MRFSKIQLGPAVRRWLLHPGSLTQKIERSLQTKLHVLSCNQGDCVANTLEQQVALHTDLPIRQKKIRRGWYREVVLGSTSNTYVYARIFVPKPIKSQLLRLKSNTQQPLGHWLYKDHQTARTLIYTDYLDCDQNAFTLASQRQTRPPKHYSLIRCSHIRSHNMDLLVTEVYLWDLIARLTDPK